MAEIGASVYTRLTPKIILPIDRLRPDGPLGSEVEVIIDIATHVSFEFYCGNVANRTVQVMLQEILTAGIPANIQCWIELSPVLSPASNIYWSAIGGGGGFLPPTAPIITVGTGVNFQFHTVMLLWVAHSDYGRLVVQVPVAGPATAYWTVQALFSGR